MEHSVLTEDAATDGMTWYDIAPDDKRCKCHNCKRQEFNTEAAAFVYVVRGHGQQDVIIHKKCLPDWWLNRVKHGETVKLRTVARVWHARGWPPKLHSVKKKEKIDFSIPKEMKPKKKK